MKKKLSTLVITLMIVIIAAVAYGYDFFNVRFNFYNSCNAIYSEDSYPVESKIKATALNKSENGIWISDPVYFQNVDQLHFAIITEDDILFKIRAILTSEYDKSVHRDFTIFTTSRFLMFKSYQIYFELPEPVQGKKYTIEVVKESEQGNQQLETL